MSAFTDLSALPRSRGTREGLVPDAAPRFIQCLVEDWAETHEFDKPTALGTPFRHSDAGKCARALGYSAAGIPASDPMDLSGVWNVGIGQRFHDYWQEVLPDWVLDRVADLFPDRPVDHVDVKCEPKVATVGADGSGHIDAVIVVTFMDGSTYTVAYELKTIGGYGYKAAVGAARKGTPAEGPKADHILQAALNGLAVDADEIVIGYLAKEAVSVNVAARFGLEVLERFCCEWTIPRSVFEPMAREEAVRVARVLELVEEGSLAPRRTPSEMPKGAEVVDPATGAWTHVVDGETVEAGSFWGCGYCKYQTFCATTEPGLIPLSSVTDRGAAA